MDMVVPGERRRGRPIQRWLDTIREDMNKYEMTNDINENRKFWKMMWRWPLKVRKKDESVFCQSNIQVHSLQDVKSTCPINLGCMGETDRSRNVQSSSKTKAANTR